MNFLKELLQAIKFILILCVVTVGIQMILDGEFDWQNTKGWIVSNFFFGLPFYFANAYLNEGLNKIYSWLDNPKKRAGIGIPAFMIMNSILMLIMIYAFSKIILGIAEPDLLSPNNVYSIFISLTICLIATLYFHAAAFFKNYVKQLEVSKQLREEKIAAELNALKAQVNPHFLFNSFNVLSGLIDENPDRAQDFLADLSKIYRYILENRNEDLSTVGEELAFAQKYFKLQQTRFEDSIRMEIDVPEDVMEKKVPSLSLQLLLENAIKHNMFDKEKPLTISILNNSDSLIIKNNKRLRRNLNGSNGVGLPNIEERYKLHRIDGFVIDEREDSFKVTLPLI